MKTMILCGGKGTRLSSHSEAMPKALVEIGSRPILWHILKIYASQGFSEFVLCLGYKGGAIKDYFLYRDGIWGSDFELDASSPEGGAVKPLSGPRSTGFKITFAETGEETPTGGRLKIASKYAGKGPFMATYGDGVADVDIGALLEFHGKMGKIGTVTVVRPESQFGEAVIGEDGLVREFREKPRMDKWVNGGFFVFEEEFLSSLGEGDVLERGPLEDLAARGQLAAYRHEGFWKCMDTFKDALVLNDLWNGGAAPWKIWD